MEMEPLPENRVTLSDRRDRLGVPIPVVSHVNSARSIETVDALLSALDSSLSATGAGRLERYAADLDPLLQNDASHHLGGLRMGRDPATSVVNDTLRFHHADNLYAAGGAVFPTGGSANPTLTVIGLSIRLAETLGRTLASDKPPVDLSRDGDGFLVIGAGRRVREDVIPAIEKLRTGHVSGVCATSRRAVFGLEQVYDAAPLSALSAQSLQNSRYIYVAVPPGNLASVLRQITQFDCSKKILIVDTPALETSDLSSLYGQFEQVAVAEDCAYLPWIPLLASKTDPIKRVEFQQSGFAYHAVALAKAVVANGSERPGIVRSSSGKRRVTADFSNGSSMVILGERAYRKGRLRFHTAAGSIIGSHPHPDAEIMTPVVENGRCIGFQRGLDQILLTDDESQLGGAFSADDNIVTRMLDIKRVGLLRLLQDLTAGGQTYRLSEGVEDAKAAPGR